MGKIQIGIHQHVFTSKLEKQNLDIFNHVKEIGYDSMDINLRNTELCFAKTVKKRADSIGLVLTGGGSLPRGKDIISKNREKRAETINYMKGIVRKASELGVKLYHGMIYATAGVFTGRGPTDEELKLAANGLHEVAQYAKDFGVSLCLEPANRYETYMLNTVDASLKLIDTIGQPNVGLLLDTYHMNIEEKDLYDAFLSAKDRIFHIHVNENDRGIPGTGHINWDDVFKAIKEIDYSGVVAVESFVDESIDIASLVAIWRKLAPDSKTLAINSYAFIKKMIKKYSIK